MHAPFRRYIQQSLTLFLLCILIVSPIFVVTPKKAQAVFGIGDIVFDPTLHIEAVAIAGASAVSAAANSLASVAVNAISIKEYILDGIFVALIRAISQQITQDIIQWINSGFEGSPMFVTDLPGFLLKIADQTAGQIIYGSELSFLCSPIDIRIALNFYYKSLSKRQQVQCTLSGAIGNVEQFVRGNFLAGGWPGMLSVSVNPVNSPMGGAFAAQSVLVVGLLGKEGLKTRTYDWGRGFLAKEVCTDTFEGGPTQCKTVTPGDTISEALTFRLETGELTLIQADEINEIIGALFAYLARTAITGAAGVFGLTNSGSGYSGSFDSGSFTSNGGSGAGGGGIIINDGGTSGGGGAGGGAAALCSGLSYLDQMANPTCSGGAGSIGSESNTVDTSSSNLFATAIQDEQDYRTMQQQIITNANDTLSAATDRGAGCSVNDVIIATTTKIKNTATSAMNAAITGTESTLLQLQLLQAQYDSGTNAERLTAINKFTALQSSGKLHTSITNATEQLKVNRILQDLETLQAGISDCPRRNNDSDNNSSNNQGS